MPLAPPSRSANPCDAFEAIAEARSVWNTVAPMFFAGSPQAEMPQMGQFSHCAGFSFRFSLSSFSSRQGVPECYDVIF